MVELEERAALPALINPSELPGIWSFLRSSIGKDLSRVAVPVYFNEPISMIQKVAEILEYEGLLAQADQESDSQRRLALVSAFAIAQFASSQDRVAKPFNPILGETYELVREEFRFVGEQVSHHPPVTAAHASSAHYEFYMQSRTIPAMSGNCMRAGNEDLQHVRLKSTGEHFTVTRPVTLLNNVLIGTMYTEHTGEMRVTNHASGEVCLVTFKTEGWGGRNRHAIEGYTYPSAATAEAGKQRKLQLSGTWSSKLFLQPMNKSGSKVDGKEPRQVVWEAIPRAPNAEQMYYLSNFALQLNNTNEGLRRKLPPTDSRLRPDQRALEHGDFDFAQSEKERVEEKQRQARRAREENPALRHEPKYFSLQTCPDSGEELYAYGQARDYWADRRSGTWGHLEDIF